MTRSSSATRFVVALLALAGASAFALECTRYLHSNLVSVDAVLGKTPRTSRSLSWKSGSQSDVERATLHTMYCRAGASLISKLNGSYVVST